MSQAMSAADPCPACGDPLVGFTLEGVEIDRCLRCGGTWLDAGELELLGVREGIEAGRLTEAAARGREGGPTDRRCARCRARLREVSIEGVAVDRCPGGDGLWFDAGEAERILATFRSGEAGAVARLLGDLTAAERPKKEGSE
jgi:Zn-finger nucleic acid-binding protein